MAAYQLTCSPWPASRGQLRLSGVAEPVKDGCWVPEYWFPEHNEATGEHGLGQEGTCRLFIVVTCHRVRTVNRHTPKIPVLPCMVT